MLHRGAVRDSARVRKPLRCRRQPQGRVALPRVELGDQQQPPTRRRSEPTRSIDDARTQLINRQLSQRTVHRRRNRRRRRINEFHVRTLPTTTDNFGGSTAHCHVQLNTTIEDSAYWRYGPARPRIASKPESDRTSEGLRLTPLTEEQRPPFR